MALTRFLEFRWRLVDSVVPHQLIGGEYNERRSQCQAAAAALGVKALRDVTSATVSAALLDPLIRARALHITGEDERVLAGVAELASGQMEKFGQLMFQSHESSRRNFENSTAFLDALVEIAATIQGVDCPRSRPVSFVQGWQLAQLPKGVIAISPWSRCSTDLSRGVAWQLPRWLIYAV